MLFRRKDSFLISFYSWMWYLKNWIFFSLNISVLIEVFLEVTIDSYAIVRNNTDPFTSFPQRQYLAKLQHNVASKKLTLV